MRKATDWIVLIVSLVGLATIIYGIYRLAGWLGVAITVLLSFLVPKKRETVEIPKESMNKTKEIQDFVEKAKHKQAEIDKKAEELQKEMEIFLEELKKGSDK